MFLVFVPVRSLVISLSLKADPRRDSSTVAFDIRFVWNFAHFPKVFLQIQILEIKLFFLH